MRKEQMEMQEEGVSMVSAWFVKPFFGRMVYRMGLDRLFLPASPYLLLPPPYTT